MLQATREAYPLLFHVLPLGGIALAAAGLVADSVKGPRWLRLLPLAVFPALAWGVGSFRLDEQPGAWPAQVVLAAACAAFYLLRVPVVTRGVLGAWGAVTHAHFQWCALLVASLGCGAWYVYGTDPAEFGSNDFSELAAGQLDESQFQPVVSACAYTDRGKEVPVFFPPAVDFTKKRIAKIEKPVLDASREQIIRIGPADLAYNCHGWTFAEGRYWIKGREVEPILQDNGYRAVESPRPNDLVVYRDGSNLVSHSGIVRAVLPGGEVLVESKWGWGGRFIHSAHSSIYGKSVKFYRSDRQGHRLQLSTDPADLFQQRAH